MVGQAFEKLSNTCDTSIQLIIIFNKAMKLGWNVEDVTECITEKNESIALELVYQHHAKQLLTVRYVLLDAIIFWPDQASHESDRSWFVCPSPSTFEATLT